MGTGQKAEVAALDVAINALLWPFPSQPEDSDGERMGASAQPQRDTDGDHPEQPQVITEVFFRFLC